MWLNMATSIAASRMSYYMTHLAYHTLALSVLSYRAQLKLLPTNMNKRERSVIQRLLHLPGSAFQIDTPFLLDFFGVSPFKSMCVWGAATMIRFSLNTVTAWRSMWSWARVFGDDFAPLIKLARGDFSPMCWDSTPFVVNIHRVLHERIYNVVVDDALKITIQNIIHTSDKVQSDIYSILLPMFFKRNPVSLAAVRLQKWAEMSAPQIQQVDWISLRDVLITNFRVAARINIVKTLLGIWCTDRRMQRVIRPCVFLWGIAGA